jgi:lysophospholipase L1-like esterase
MRRVKLCMFFVTVLLSACGGKKGPTAPSPQQLALTCPSRVEATANDGAGASVTFAIATQGGTQPVAFECSPAAGEFSVGETHVVCNARDAASQTATCDFLVVVVVPPKIAFTRFDAFGDSITEGVVSLTPTLLQRLAMPEAYPAKLENLLATRYTSQTITVVNQGVGGERLATGRKRLPGVLDKDHPDVVLLLEGINNIREVTTAELADDLDRMVVTARRRGVQVMLATLLPISSSREQKMPGTMADIRALNGEIVRIADKYRTGPVVDAYSVFSASPSLIGSDGLHPTAEGYNRLAEVFFDAIKSRYEVAAPPDTLTAVRSIAPVQATGARAPAHGSSRTQRTTHRVPISTGRSPRSG